MFLKRNIKILLITLTIAAMPNAIKAMEFKPIEIETKKPPEKNENIKNQEKIEKEIEEIEKYVDNLERNYCNGSSTLLVFSENPNNIDNLNKNILKLEQLEKEEVSSKIKEKINTLKNKINKFKEKLEKELNKKIEKQEKIKQVFKEYESTIPNKKEIEEIEKYVDNLERNYCNSNSTLLVFSENPTNIENLNKNILKLEQLEKEEVPSKIKEKIATLKNKINKFKEKLEKELNKKIEKHEKIEEREKQKNKEILEKISDIELNIEKIENIKPNLIELIKDYITQLETYNSDLVEINNRTKNIPIKDRIEEIKNKINNLIKEFKNYTLINDNLTQIEKEIIPKIKEDINYLKKQNFNDINNIIKSILEKIKIILENLNRLKLKLEKLEKEEAPKQTKNKIIILKETISTLQEEIKNQNEIFEEIKKIEQTDFNNLNPDKIEKNINNLKKYAEHLKNEGYNLKDHLTNLLIKQFENYIPIIQKENFESLDIWSIEDHINFLKNYVNNLKIIKEEINNINIKNKIDEIIKNSEIKIPSLLLELLKFYILKLEQKNYAKLSSNVIDIYIPKIKISKSDLIEIEKKSLTNNVKVEINNLKNRIIDLEKKIETQNEINIYLNKIEKIEQKDLNKLENKELAENITNLKNYLQDLIEIERKITNGKEEKETIDKINEIKNRICSLELNLNKNYIKELENKYSNKSNITNPQNQIENLNKYKLNLIDISSKSTENETKNEFNILIKKIEIIIDKIKISQNEKIENFFNEFEQYLNNIKKQDFNNKATTIIFKNNILNIEGLNQHKLKLEELEKEEISEQIREKINNSKNKISNLKLNLENELNNKIDEKDDLNFKVEQNINEIKKYIENIETKNLNSLNIGELKEIKDEITKNRTHLQNLYHKKTNDINKFNIASLEIKSATLLEKLINEITIKFSNILNEIQSKNFNNKLDIINTENILKGCILDLKKLKEETTNEEIIKRINNLIKEIIPKIQSNLYTKRQQLENINSIENKLRDFDNKYENITSHIKDLGNIITNLCNIENKDTKLIEENTLKGTVIMSNLDSMYLGLTKILDSIKELSNKIYENDTILVTGKNYIKKYIENKNKVENLKSEIEDVKFFYEDTVKFKIKNK